MSKELTENFVDALRGLETGGDVEVMIPLFADECEIGNTALKDTLKGTGGVREFWTNYRGTFAELGSESRMNVPGSATDNWTWQADAFPDDDVARRLHEIANSAGRV